MGRFLATARRNGNEKASAISGLVGIQAKLNFRRLIRVALVLGYLGYKGTVKSARPEERPKLSGPHAARPLINGMASIKKQAMSASCARGSQT
jgi:hypothetical protein